MNPIDPATTVGAVQLTVSDLDRSRAFYERALGMRSQETEDGGLTLGAFGVAEPLLELHGDSAAAPHDPRRTGLFHFAVLVADRRELSLALLRLARSGWPLSGASDHLVSEALYLDDPDGNGIELYRDRPRTEWRRDEDGQLQMATLPLDLHGLLAEAGDEVASQAVDDLGLPAGTRMGHVHLQVSELARTEDFYSGVLGFDVMVRGYPGALFVAAGGYHHHIGLNTWNSRGAQGPPPGAVGLRSFDVRLPDPAALADVVERVRAAGLPMEALPDGGSLVRDPSGNGIRLTARAT